jgi:hypothetical protein
MGYPIHRPTLSAFGASLCLMLLLSALAAPALASAPVHFQRESYQALLVQIRHGEVHALVLHPQGYKAHASLDNGGHFTAAYAPAEVAKLEALARAHNAAFTVAKSTPKAAVHHKLRYIAGGILIVVILVVLAVLLVGRRRALSEEEAAAGAAPRETAAAPPGPGSS